MVRLGDYTLQLQRKKGLCLAVKILAPKNARIMTHSKKFGNRKEILVILELLC